MGAPDQIAWTTDEHGNRRLACPTCGEPMTSGTVGLTCLSCGHHVHVQEAHRAEATCPTCGRAVRPRLDRPGLICERCGWSTPPASEAVTERPYRSPEQALYAYVEAVSAAESSPSLLGGQLERMALGLESNRGTPPAPQQYRRIHMVLGDLSAPWGELDGEEQTILRAWAAETIWQDGGSRCLKCGAEYLPETIRVCLGCGEVRPWDESVCTCGSARSMLCRGCPRCGNPGRANTRTHHDRVVTAINDYRMALFVQHHGRRPGMRVSERQADEGKHVGYCPRCGRWYQDDELWSRRRCPVHRVAVRWGVRVDPGRVRQMYGDAVHRWGSLLRALGLA